ncbi:MAG: hypothetical protein Kow0047_34130 [Anaerolineae bacterium]
MPYMRSRDDEIKAAYERGRYAYLADIPLEHNPYDEKEWHKREAWRLGWMQEQKRSERWTSRA